MDLELNTSTVAKEMINFIRSPTWITPEFNADLAPQGRETKFSGEQIERFKSDSDYFLQYRKRLYQASGANYPVYYKDSPNQKSARERFGLMMKERLGQNEELASKLIPSFSVGCRR